jgi:hypothetical protein
LETTALDTGVQIFFLLENNERFDGIQLSPIISIFVTSGSGRELEEELTIN